MMATHGRTRRSIGGKRLATIIVAVAVALVVPALTWGYVARGPDIRTVALSQPPQGEVVLDPSTGHAFILTYTVDPVTHAINPDAHLSILDVRSGRLVRTIHLGFDPRLMVLDARRKTLLVSGNEDTLIRIDTRSGRVLSSSLTDPASGNMIVDASRDRIYVSQSGSGANVIVMDARNGSALHEVWFGGGRYLGDDFNVGDVAVDRAMGRVLVSYTDGSYSGTPSTVDSVALLDSNGRILRTLTLARFPGQQNTGTPSLAVDSVHGRAVILDPNTTRATTIDVRDGRTLNVVQLGAKATPNGPTLFIPLASAASAGLDERAGRLLIPMMRRVVCQGMGHCVPTGPHGRLYLLDTRTGRVLRRLPISADDSDVTFDARDRCFLVGVAAFGARMSTLYVVDAVTGATLHRIPLGRGTLYPISDPGTGRFYLATTHGTISLLDVRAGRTVSSLTVPAATMAGQGSQGNQGSQGAVNLLVLDGCVIVLRDTSGIVPPDPFGWLPSWFRHALPWQPPRPRAVPGTVSTFDAPH